MENANMLELFYELRIRRGELPPFNLLPQRTKDQLSKDRRFSFFKIGIQLKKYFAPVQKAGI